MDKLDIKLWTLAAKGQIVPDRSLLKTPQQIEAIKKKCRSQHRCSRPCGSPHPRRYEYRRD